MKNEIQVSKVKEAKEIWRKILALENTIRRDSELILRAAYTFGAILCELKEDVGHGKWTIWLCANFSELGETDSVRMRHGQRCMDFFRRNAAKTKDSSLLSEVPAQWDAEAKRKFMYGYVPVKERALMQGDEKDAPGVHHLTWVNNFHKWDRQIAVGLAEFPHISVLQHELEQPFKRIAEICGREWALGILHNYVQLLPITKTFDSDALTNGKFLQ